MLPNFEQRMMRGENTERKLSEAQEGLYTTLVSENKENAIDIKTFEDLYGKEAVEADAREVERHSPRRDLTAIPKRSASCSKP